MHQLTLLWSWVEIRNPMDRELLSILERYQFIPQDDFERESACLLEWVSRFVFVHRSNRKLPSSPGSESKDFVDWPQFALLSGHPLNIMGRSSRRQNILLFFTGAVCAFKLCMYFSVRKHTDEGLYDHVGEPTGFSSRFHLCVPLPIQI